MPYEVKSEQRSDYLHVRITGEIGPGMSINVAREVLDAHLRNPLPAVLVDVRGLVVDVGPAETMALVSAYPDLLKGNHARTAVVYDERDRRLLQFYETVAVNRGYPTQIFGNLSDALQWLGVSPPEG